MNSACRLTFAFIGEVEILDPKSGRWILEERPSTFFPKQYSRIDMRRAILEAFANAEDFGDGRFIGTSHRGIRIEMIVDAFKRIVTAYPVREIPP